MCLKMYTVIICCSVCSRSRGLPILIWPVTFSSWWNLEAFSTGSTWLSFLRSLVLGGPSVGGLMKLKGFGLRDVTSRPGRKLGGGYCLFWVNVTSSCLTRTPTCCTASLICKILTVLSLMLHPMQIYLSRICTTIHTILQHCSLNTCLLVACTITFTVIHWQK